MATSAPLPTTSDPPAKAEPIIIDTQHDDMVHDSQLDFYGCKLATASSDRTVKIYDVTGSTYSLTATLQGHLGPVWEVSWAHPKYGVVLASCSFDGSVHIHRESTPKHWIALYQATNLHESSVNSVSFAPQEYGLVVAAGSSDGRVSVLTHQKDDSWTKEYLTDNALGVNSVSWAPYGAYKVESGEEKDASMETMRLVTGGCDNRIRFWSKAMGAEEWVEDPAPLGSSVGHSDWVRDVAWAPAVVPGVNVVASCSEDRTVILWTQEGGATSVWEPKVLHTFDAPVWRLSWSITGSILAVSSGDSSVTLWKQTLEGEWMQVSTVEDVATSKSTEGQ